MTYSSNATGILLAAGLGTRFDPSGRHNKLLATLPGGTPVVFQSARKLLAVSAEVIAVVRPGAEKLADVLNEAGCSVIFSTDAERGMGAALGSHLHVQLPHSVAVTSGSGGALQSTSQIEWVVPPGSTTRLHQLAVFLEMLLHAKRKRSAGRSLHLLTLVPHARPYVARSAVSVPKWDPDVNREVEMIGHRPGAARSVWR